MRKLMVATGLKQAQLARKIGISQTTVSNWIRNKQSPVLTQWEKVLTFVASDEKSQHLLARAPSVSIDGMVAPYDLHAKNTAATLVEAYLRTVKRP
jgi:transcriptional regulator with XRE-family HTH domain